MYAQMNALCDRLANMPPDTRLNWFGPDMGLRMFTTARQMETWAHGQEIFDVIGVAREPTDRLRNIAEIGVRTFGGRSPTGACPCRVRRRMFGWTRPPAAYGSGMIHRLRTTSRERPWISAGRDSGS